MNPLAVVTEGVAAFAAPCFLVLLPLYVALLATLWLTPRRASAAGVGSGMDQRTVLGGAALFAVGFVAGFVLSGAALAEAAPAVSRDSRWLVVPAGVVLLLAGPLSWAGRTAPLVLPWRVPVTLLAGAVIALNWTPCVGPVLGGLFNQLVRAPNAAVLAGLGLYGAALTLPLLPVALLVGWLGSRLRALQPLVLAGRIAAGAVLSLGGAALLTGTFTRLLGLVPLVWPSLG